uniref:Uncharacterized protein n=1 Tax=Lepeophtheirus salmonis TaxID=72036 RepID=A0A0K2UCL4_LEPSM
MNFHQFRHLQ